MLALRAATSYRKAFLLQEPKECGLRDIIFKTEQRRLQKKQGAFLRKTVRIVILIFTAIPTVDTIHFVRYPRASV